MSLSLALAIAAAAGTAVGVFADPLWLSPVRWLLAIAAVATFLCASRQHLAWARRSGFVGLGAVCALLASAAEQAALHSPLRTLLEQRLGGFAIDSVGAPPQDTPIEVEGRLLADAALTESGALLRLRVERVWIGPCPEPAVGGVSLMVTGALAAEAMDEWRAGRRIKAPALLRRPARYLNAGVPDQERLLARRGLSLVGSVKSAALVEVAGRGHWFDESAASVRASVRRAMARHVAVRDPQSAAVATAILIGDRGSLDSDVERRLQEAGTYHVIAISGGNIAILAGLILGALWWLRIRDGWAAGAAVALLAWYAFVAGGGPSVTRATVMAAIYLSLRMIDQRTAPSHAMALTAAAVLVVTPLAIADVGFWLTFGATAAIVVGTTRIGGGNPSGLPGSHSGGGNPFLGLPVGKALRAVSLVIVASACAEAALMPIGALVFQRVTLAGLVVNLVAVPCMAIVQVASMVTAAFDAAGITGAAQLAGLATHVAVRGLIDSAALVDMAPWLTWRVPSPSLLVVAAYYASLLLWLWASWASRAKWLALGLFVWIAIAPPTLARQFGDGRLHLTVMDVGQGDAMLVTLPNGRTLMVDSGGVSLRGDFDIGDRVIGPALRARGIVRLDYLAITHGDPDHIGGAASLVKDFAPRELWAGTFVANHEPTLKLQGSSGRHRAAWRWLQKGDRLGLGGVELRVHHPPLPEWERQKVRNDDSLVIELRYGQVSMLLTGDIGREVEQALIPTLDLLPVVVLKSPHHGSGTSSSPAFIDAVKPAVVVISNGRGNTYGHPVPYVLERYRSIGARIFRTDQEGQIEVSTDGQDLVVRTFSGRRVDNGRSASAGARAQVGGSRGDRSLLGPMGINSAPTGRLLTGNLVASAMACPRQPQEAVASTFRPSRELPAVWSACGS
ncbi:MAG: DNA internalization-related competence protein ComEC/Rec2 [Acidobacteriota bacterium]|nr:DNA internalization-related competence protein ComEC/Rec2 [Acidobacteriota bacterium]